ncbi:MAG: hypothetical protein RL556_614 [Actinomycetota bacterium]|jgi:hypothetical protein
MFKKSAIATMLSLALFFATIPDAATATKCRNAGPSDGSFSLGSQVDGRIFTVCADSSATKTTSKAKPKKPQSQPAQDPRVNPVGQVIFSTVRVGNSSRVTFRPVAPKISKSTPAILAIGQAIEFRVDQSKRFGATWILSHRLGVRFTPVSVTLSITDGTKFTTYAASHRFRATGKYRVSAKVTYAVAYRKLKAGEFVNKRKAKWVSDPGLVSIATKTLTVTVGTNSVGHPVLISSD